MAKSLNSTFAARAHWGRLTVIEFARTARTAGGQTKPIWRFRCSCGAEVEKRAYDVVAGKTTSCGCAARDAKIEVQTRHGHAAKGALSLTYRSWRNMVTRGRNPNIECADRYSLRGIVVADEWLPGGDGLGFSRFLAHAGDRPTPAHTIDRIDNDLPYQPGNVRWSLSDQQANNRSSNVRIEHEGESLTVAQLAKRTGVKPSVIRDRIRLGWPVERLCSPRARAAFGTGRRSRPGVKPRHSQQPA
jgi:hypothetical protein